MDYELANRLIAYNQHTGEFTAKTEEFIKVHCDLGATGVSYWLIRVRGKTYLAHRVAWLLVIGSWPEKLIDHIDRNPINNKWGNLRHTTYSGNALNTEALGVSWHKNRKYWITHIKYKGKKLYLGHYNDKEEAIAVVATKRAELIASEAKSLV